MGFQLKASILGIMCLSSQAMQVSRISSEGMQSRTSDRVDQLKQAGGVNVSKKLSIPALTIEFTSKSPRKHSPTLFSSFQIERIYQAREAINNVNILQLEEILSTESIDFTPKPYELTSASFALLMQTVRMRNAQMCELLLKAGANVNASSIEYPKGNTVLSETIAEGFFPRSSVGILELCTLMIKYGAKITSRCCDMAALSGNEKIKQLMAI